MVGKLIEKSGLKIQNTEIEKKMAHKLKEMGFEVF